MDNSTFADRLWWARHKAQMGATKLARLVHCTQSLISGLERSNAEGSKYNNKFAHALGVDPTWLAHGVGDRAPPGFSAEEARNGRENQSNRTGPIVRMPSPAWAHDSPLAEPLAPLRGADAMQEQLVHLFYAFVRLAGTERSLALADTFRKLIELLAFEETHGKQKLSGVPDERHDRT